MTIIIKLIQLILLIKAVQHWQLLWGLLLIDENHWNWNNNLNDDNTYQVNSVNDYNHSNHGQSNHR